MSEGYSNLRAQWESRMKESEAQSALSSASPGAGDRKKPSSTGSIPPWKKSAQAAAAKAKAKAKETDGARSLVAPSSTNAEDTVATPSWTRPSLTTHHAAETVEKYVASPSSNDEASPTAATATAGGGQAEIVEERSLSVSAAKSMFGGSVATKSRSSYGDSTGISGSGVNSNDRAARWKAEAAAASAAVGDDDDYNVEEDRITSITVTDAKSMFDRPSASAAATASSTSDAPGSRPKWLTGGGSPPSASATGSGVPEAYAELFGVAHEYDKEKGTALGASGIIAEDEEEESGESASGGDDQGGRPAWLQGQSESGEEIMEEEDKDAPQTYQDNTDIADDVPDMASEPVVADWLQAEDQDEVVKAEKMDEADEPPPKKRGWGTNLMKWLERKESGSGSDNNGSDKGSSRSQDQPEIIQEENPIHENDNAFGSGAYGDESIEPSEGEEEGEEGPRRKQTEEEEDILAMMEAENQRYAQGEEVATTHRTTHYDDEDEAEIMEMDTMEHDDVSDEDNIQDDPEENVATVALGAVVAGAGIAAATAAATSAPSPGESAPVDFASSPTPSVEDEAEAEVDASYEETFDDYADGYDDEYGGGHDAESYSDRSTEGLEANLSSAYGLGAADNDDYYQDQDEYGEDDYMEDLDDNTVQDLEASYDREEGEANKSYTTVDKLEDEFLTETGERSSQERMVEENEDTIDEQGVGRGRPALYPEDSELSLDNTTVADERARLRQELEMEILQEDVEEGPTEAQVATEDHTSIEGFEAEASSSDDEPEDNTPLKAAALGLAAAAVAGGTAGAVAAARTPEDVPPPPEFSNVQDDPEMDYDESHADAPLDYEEQTYPVAVASADITDETSGTRFEEEPNEVEPNEEKPNEDEAFYAEEDLGNYENSEAGADADADIVYANEDAPYSDQSAPQDGGGDWGEEEHYADDDYPLYPHPSTDANEDAAGDKLYDYEDTNSGYSHKIEAIGDFSDEGSGREDAAEDQEEEGYSETNYPDGDQSPYVQEDSMFEESMNSEALNERANLMREELIDEIDRGKQEQGSTDEGHASAESYDYYNEPESKRELKARIDSIHSEVVVDEDKDENSGPEAGAVVGAAAAATSSDDYHDEDNSVKDPVENEADDSSDHGHEAMAVAGAAALAAAATAGGIAAASTEEEVQVPVTSAPKEDQYAPRASHVSYGEETHLTWGESDLNAAPEPPAQYSEPGANSENYLEEKEEESGYDEYCDYYDDGDADYNDGNVIAMDMAAPIDFSNPPPEPLSDAPYDDDGYGHSNDDDGYYQEDDLQDDGYHQDYAETEQDGYYQEGDLQDDYYQSNEFPQDHQEGGFVGEEDEWEWGESDQAQGTSEKEEDQNNEAAYAAGGLVAAAALGGGIAATASTGDDALPSNPVGPDKEPGDYGPKARSPSIRLKKSVVEEQRPRERLPMDAIVESESFPEVERDIEVGYDEGFLPDEHLQDAAMSAKASTSVSTSKRVSWDKDIDQDHPGNMKKWCILAVIIVALGGIALGVSFSLSKRNNSSSDTQNAQGDTPSTSPHVHDDSHEHPEILITQVGGAIAGPSRTFEYGPGINGQFGSSLSLSGDGTRVAIGAPNYSASIFSQGERLGLVQVFEQQNRTWTKLEPDIFGDLSGDATGTSVSLSSDGMTLAVGSPEHLDAIFGGQVILYRFTDDGVWQQIGSPIIGDDAFDRLGTSVSLSDTGDRVAISQPTDKAGGAARKVAKVYELQNDDWVQLGDDLVGRSGSDPVSMSGDGRAVALGSLSRAENNHRAAIRTYHYVNETNTNETVGWKFKGSEIELEGNKGSPYDTLWMPSLSTDGNILAIGSAIENFNKTENSDEQQVLQVLAYRFDQEFDDWVEIPVNTNLVMQGLDLSRFSTSLSGDGHELVVGDSGAGIIEILHLSDEGAYMPVTGNVELKREDGSDDAFGYSVAVSPDGIYLASGAPQQVVAGEPVGSVSVFQMEITEHHR